MKQKSPAARTKKTIGEAKDDKAINIHQVRRKIEDIPLEREQNKHFEL
ncbi:hypothetical protein [Vibrio rhodolitus]|nr:hypothetical protein [Vibrio rhodolitus]